MKKLPPLTAHALDLSERFSGVQEMADAFAMGSVGLEAREKEALCASIISALFRYPDYIFSVDSHLGYPDRCARLLYAALYAQWSVMPRPDAIAYVNGLIEVLEPYIDNREYDLFEGAIQTEHLRTEESLRSHLRTAMCVADIRKFVPGLFERDLNWVEPDLPLFVRRKPQRERKNPAKTFAFLGLAQ